MSAYLRDLTLKNLLITEDRLVSLHAFIEGIVAQVNALLPAADPTRLQITYMIRSDNRGYVLNNFPEVLTYFREARQVQRIVILVATPRNNPFPPTLDTHGKGISIQLSQDEVTHNAGIRFEVQILPQVSALTVTDDNRDWTEGTFLRVQEQLARFTSIGSTLIRTPFVPVAIQILIGIVVFGLALVGALQFSKFFTGEQAGAVTFVLLLVVINPIFSLIQNPLIRLINFYSPNVAFRDRKTHWLTQAIVGVVITAVLVTLGHLMYSAVSAALQPYLNVNTH